MGADTMTQGAAGRRPVYFSEFNVLMDKTAYLPLVSGLLRASVVAEVRAMAGHRLERHHAAAASGPLLS